MQPPQRHQRIDILPHKRADTLLLSTQLHDQPTQFVPATDDATVGGHQPGTLLLGRLPLHSVPLDRPVAIPGRCSLLRQVGQVDRVSLGSLRHPLAVDKALDERVGG